MKPPRLLITTTLLLALPAQAVRTNELVGSFKIAADLSRRSSQELAVKQAATIITTYIASSVDTDGDPFPEPPPFRTGAGPAGGGLVPLNLGAPITDGYGANLGYCAWDNGSVTVSTNRLPGSTSDTGAVTFAVVSAGLDGVFNRTCAQIASGAVTTDDDFVASYSTAQIRQGVGGTVYFGDPVADMTALGALTSTRDGELRLVKSDNTLWRWNTAGSNWTSASNTYTANNVIITGGTINGTAIGNVTPSSGGFTTLAASAGITGNLTGNVTGNLVGNITGNVIGNADTATRLAVARNIGMTGDGNWSVAFDGSGDATGALVLASTGVNPGSYGTNVSVPTFTVDAKGRLIAAANIAITPSLSSLTGAAAANTIGNGAYAQSWNWQLTGNTSAFSIGETAASTGGSGTQYLMNVGTLAASTAIPLSVSVRGIEAFRVDSVNPQLVANNGTVAAPGYAFAGQQSTGFYLPATGQLAASVAGTRSLWLTAGSASFGSGALLNDTSATATAIGASALAANTTGAQNTAVGGNALLSNTTGQYNTAVGYQAMRSNTLGVENNAFGREALYDNNSGNSNVAVGTRSQRFNISGNKNIAVGGGSLLSNNTGSSNVAVGDATLFFNTAGDNVAIGDATLFSNLGGMNNAALGSAALYANTSGNNNTALGENAGYRDATFSIANANTTGNNNTFIGANAMSGSATQLNYATALGSGSLVSSPNTIVLGRAADATVIGATADDLSGYKLQVTGGIQSTIPGSGTGLNMIQTVGGFGSYLDIGASTYPGATNSNAATIRFIDAGFWTDHITFRTKNTGAAANPDTERMRLTSDGKLLIGSATDDGSGSLLQVTGGIKALTGGLSVAGGDLVLGSGTVSGLLSARPAFGVANRIYIGTDTNTIYRDTGSAWVALGSAGAASLSSLTAATTANTIANGVNAQNWNWQLTGNTSAFSIGETAASTGGSGTQYLMNIGTLAASTAVPMRVSVRGVEAFRVDSVNPQLVANNGTVAAPGYAFAGQPSTGFYLPATGQLGASVAGTRSVWLTTGSASIGQGALLNDTSANATAVGTNAMTANTSGIENSAFGFNALTSNTTGIKNTATGFESLKFNTTGNENTAFGRQALLYNTTGNSNVGAGPNALLFNTTGNSNVAVGGGSLFSNVNGSSNVAVGNAALFFNTASDNIAMGDGTLFSNNSGAENVALGGNALRANTTGNGNVAVGRFAGFQDAGNGTTNANVAGNYNTFLGNRAMTGTTATINYATALGAAALVSSSNTVVLGRTSDVTVIGATADDVSGYQLQVTGGIKALTGGLRVAGGDLVLGSGTVSGLLSARPAFGVANRIYVSTDTNEIYRDTGGAWNRIAAGAAGGILASADFANQGTTTTVLHGNAAGNPSWSAVNLTSDVSGVLPITSGGTGNSTVPVFGNIFMSDGSKLLPTTLSFVNGTLGTASNGTTATITFTNPQQLGSVNSPTFTNLTLSSVLRTASGTAGAPSHTFSFDLTTGLYRPAAGQFGVSVAGTRSMWITAGSVSLGSGALASDSAPATNFNVAVGLNALNATTTGVNNTAVGYRTLALNVSGADNAAFGANALRLSTGSSNTGLGSGTLYSNTTGSFNTAVGRDALNLNVGGTYNTALGNESMYNNTSGTYNVATGYTALRNNSTGSYNVANGYQAGLTTTNAITGSNSTFIGTNATIADTAQMASASNITLFGAGATASGITGANGQDVRMTAIGAGASVTSINTVVLGRAADSTVIGATADDLSGYKLQVTGGIKALTGGLSLAGGDLVLGSGTVSGLLSARPAFGVANRIYIGTDTNTIYRDTGSAWVALGSAGAVSLSSLTAATAANTIANGVNAQNWNWQLVGNTTAFSIGETAASTGGSGNQYLMNIGTLASSTAIPLRVSTRGVEAFRVDSVNPQLVANLGSAIAPAYSFNGQQGTGLYFTNYAGGNSRLAGSVDGTQAMVITTGNVGAGYQALINDVFSSGNNSAFGAQALQFTNGGTNNTAVGAGTLTTNQTGNNNVAVGVNALNKSTASSNVAIGPDAMAKNTSGTFNVAVGNTALYRNLTGNNNVANGYQALQDNLGSNNVATGYGALSNSTTGTNNVAYGYIAGNTNSKIVTGSNSVFIGANSGVGNDNFTSASGAITLLGSNSIAALGATSTNAFMTAIGSGASVTSINTVVLGRAADSTVIGATADDLSGYKLQVTGGIKAVSGGLNLAAGTTTVAPLRFNSGTNLTAAVAGAMEFNGTNLFMTITGPTRKTIAFTDSAMTGDGSGMTNLNAANIASGTLAVARGGTGLGTTPSNGQLLIGNGSGYTLASLTGTTNQITVTPGAGSITLSLPQNIAPTSAPTFAGMTLTGALSGTTATFTSVATGDGTVGAPGYAFSADATTGLYRPAAGQLAASVAGVRSMWITASSTAIGTGALASGSSSPTSYNVAVGLGALNSNTAGNENTAIGSYALYNNIGVTGGYRNSASGMSALNQNTTGYENTASGAYALEKNTIGTSNVASGAYALLRNTTGSSNTALGASAGYTATNSITGSNSTFVGASASVADTVQMVSASNITLLGAGATASGLGSSNLDARMTAIGAGASVTSINTVVLGRTTDNVAIGQTFNGAYKLTVNGTAGGTSAYAVSSDARFKMNITPVINAIGTIRNLQGVHYEFNRAAFPEKNFENGRQLGFIAQQIEPFVPEVVRTDRDGFKGVQYSQLVPLLVEAIKEQQLTLQHLVKKDPATLLVDIKTFQGNDAVFQNIKSTNIKTANLEAENARIKKLEADRIDTKYLRSDVMKTGETEVFVSLGSFQPIFVPLADAQYIVNATADDGSSAFASVAFMGGKITVTPISGKGVDVTTMGSQVGLVAASKKIKATWIRMS
ncbi:tail fiber domain-containing protein [Actimicrobium antarcticum]|uniref:ESPR-type extended signal peptide-containing protein n=1 Tax=Actimicrobium antarcticum TaxID=1051899 RepID=A0ABP7TR99_9BURK